MNRQLLCTVLLGMALLGCAVPHSPVRENGGALASETAGQSAHDAEVLAWRETRVGNLRKPDGWLSLVGLHWLSEGEQSVGSARDNVIVLATGPKRLGVMTVAQGKLQFMPDTNAQDVKVQNLYTEGWQDVAVSANGYAMEPDSGKQPGRILVGNEVGVALIERGGKLALRVKDSNAPTRMGFAGIDYYDIDASWRIEADWTAHATPQTFEIQNVLGMIEKMPSPGYISFTREGRAYRLHPVLEAGSDELFFIFGDRTNGRETYGPGRFFYAKPAVNGKVVVDFNKAYNPPCAFTEFSTCPLPPPENRLDLAVRAGEKKYAPH